MQTQLIPNTSLNPSVLCLGTGDLGGAISRQDSFAILDEFTAAGGSFIDTAKIYSDWRPGEQSVSEKTIGEWIKKRGQRDRVILATKGAHPDLAAMHIPRCSPPEIIADLEASLVNLGVETIDIYYLHRDDPARPVEEILETLEAQVRSGKITHYACSNWRPARIQAAQTYASSHGLAGFVINQPLWNFALVEYANLADSTLTVMDSELRQLHFQSGLACAPFSSQANGFFHKLLNGLPENSLSSLHRKMYLTDINRARAARLRQFCKRSRLSITQVILGYLLSQPFPTFPIIGARTLEYLRDSLTAAPIRLRPEDLSILDG